jgi:hypothetical protein
MTEKKYEYTYPVINTLPSTKEECIGFIADTLEWGQVVILEYKNAKHMTIGFLDSGTIMEGVQKASLAMGLVKDAVMSEHRRAAIRDNAIKERCIAQIKKMSKRQKLAMKRILNKKVYLRSRRELLLERIGLLNKAL